MKNYFQANGSDAAMILLLGSGGNNPLTKGVAKWLVKRGVNALCVGPENGPGYHSFPLESVEEAIQIFKRAGQSAKWESLARPSQRFRALAAAARFPELSLTIAVTPCDLVLQGFSKEKRDGCAEWPVEGESMLTWRGEALPYVPYAYQHPEYWRVVTEETKGSGQSALLAAAVS